MPENNLVPPEPPSAAPPPPPSDPPPASSGGGDVSENRTLWVVLSYLWILALVPFLAEQKDKEVQWHAKHGLVLTGAEIVLWILFTVLNTVVACVGCFLSIPVFIVVIVVRILCITKAMNGERFLIPGLSELADRF